MTMYAPTKKHYLMQLLKCATGKMNLSNLAGAAAIAKYVGVADEKIAGAVGGFKSLPHRLERRGTVCP